MAVLGVTESYAPPISFEFMDVELTYGHVNPILMSRRSSMKDHETKAVGYVRVSTEEQAKEGLSIEAQEERIRALAKAKGWVLLNIIKDPGFSGKNLNRPGIGALIELCQQGATNVVIVFKVDRLTRKQKDLWHLLEEVFDANQVGFVSVTEAFDTTTAAGKAFLGMLGVFAQLERDLVSERTREALNQKKSKGEWIGRKPTGFRMNDGGKLEEDHDVSKLIARAKRLRRKGASFGDISRAIGIPKTTIHRLVSANARTRKADYLNNLTAPSVP
jgi:DNA invertase Pin-like site-specific DNA recombinase